MRDKVAELQGGTTIGATSAGDATRPALALDVRHDLRHSASTIMMLVATLEDALHDVAERAALDGISRAQGGMGVDIGASEKPMIEVLPTIEEKGLGFEPLPGPRGVADDLKKLTGVSPAIEKKLNDLGIFHYTQIAELSADAAHNVGEEVGLPGRVQGWVSKAKELTAE